MVLSACETGLGDAVAGEWVAGLNQAFLKVGAQRIVLSQRRVPDAQTAELMAAFYARYTRGTEAAEALRQVKLTMKRRGLPPPCLGGLPPERGLRSAGQQRTPASRWTCRGPTPARGWKHGERSRKGNGPRQGRAYGHVTGEGQN